MSQRAEPPNPNQRLVVYVNLLLDGKELEGRRTACLVEPVGYDATTGKIRLRNVGTLEFDVDEDEAPFNQIGFWTRPRGGELLDTITSESWEEVD